MRRRVTVRGRSGMMTSAMSRLAPVCGAVTLGVLLAPGGALAHGIGGSARDKSVVEFVPLGIEHMLLGWDHLLFIAGVVLLAGELGRAAKLISLFVAGHSLTLLVATLSGWRVDATLVDVVIALSVVYVGVQGLRGRPENWRTVGAVVFGFGLVHGLGLSTRLQDLGLPEDGLLWRVIAFNVGVEVGQLCAIAVIVGIGWLVGRRWRWPALQRAGYGVLVVAGLVAAAVLSISDGSDDASLTASRFCEETASNPPPALAGQHPAKSFYRPGDEVPGADLAHVVGDGYVIVFYDAGLPGARRERLSEWVTGGDHAVIAAPDGRQSEPLKAITAQRELSCSRFEIDTVADFSERWFTDIREGRVQ